MMVFVDLPIKLLLYLQYFKLIGEATVGIFLKELFLGNLLFFGRDFPSFHENLLPTDKVHIICDC